MTKVEKKHYIGAIPPANTSFNSELGTKQRCFQKVKSLLQKEADK